MSDNVVQLPDRTGYATKFKGHTECLDALEDSLRFIGCKWQRSKISELVKQLELRGVTLAPQK